MPVGRGPGGCNAGDCLGRAEECPDGCRVARLAQHHINQRTGAVDRTIQVDPTALHLQIHLVNVPAAPHLAAPTSAEVLGECRGEFGFPVPDRLMAGPAPWRTSPARMLSTYRQR